MESRKKEQAGKRQKGNIKRQQKWKLEKGKENLEKYRVKKRERGRKSGRNSKI